MKKLVLAIAMALAATSAFAQKNCDELKSEISTKIEANGVKEYTLEIVAADAVKDAKVVGTCEAGTKKITYKRGK